jgi:hypothetical protein
MHKKLIKELKQASKMWLGPKYSDREYHLYYSLVEPILKELIEDYSPADLENFFTYIVPTLSEIRSKVLVDKAPRTGFKPPTEKEKREFDKLFSKITVNPELIKALNAGTTYVDEGEVKITKSIYPQLFSERVPQSFFFCKKHKIRKTKVKMPNGQLTQKCISCNPEEFNKK